MIYLQLETETAQTTFELFNADGTTANVTSFTSSGAMKHGVVVLSNVNGTFSAGETITGGTSGVTDVIQVIQLVSKVLETLNCQQLNKLVWQVHQHIQQILL